MESKFLNEVIDLFMNKPNMLTKKKIMRETNISSQFFYKLISLKNNETKDNNYTPNIFYLEKIYRYINHMDTDLHTTTLVILEALKTTNLKSSEISKKAGITRQYLHKIKTGRNGHIQIDVAEKLYLVLLGRNIDSSMDIYD